MSTEHVWTAVALVGLSPAEATLLAGQDAADRGVGFAQLLSPLGPDQVDGPICRVCRVHWRDVHADPGKAWPCPGERPRQLGGPLQPPPPKTRQQRRAEQRKVAKTKPAPPGLEKAATRAVQHASMRSRIESSSADNPPELVNFFDPPFALPERVRL